MCLPFGTGVPTEQIQERFLLQKAMSTPALQVSNSENSSCLPGLARFPLVETLALPGFALFPLVETLALPGLALFPRIESVLLPSHQDSSSSCMLRLLLFLCVETLPLPVCSDSCSSCVFRHFLFLFLILFLFPLLFLCVLRLHHLSECTHAS